MIWLAVVAAVVGLAYAVRTGAAHALVAPSVELGGIEAQSKEIQEALADASSKPLNDLDTRLVVVIGGKRAIIDVPLLRMRAFLETHARAWSWKMRRMAAPAIWHAMASERPNSEFITYLALAYFDRQFLPRANAGLTRETACNTLLLDLRLLSPKKIFAGRAACRLETPVGRIDLSGRDFLGLGIDL